MKIRTEESEQVFPQEAGGLYRGLRAAYASEAPEL